MKETMNTTFDAQTEKNVDLWLNGHYDNATKDEIRKLITENPQEVTDAFYTNLSFGTAGLRGIMGVGSNRMNVYTVRAATQALANWINKQPKTAQEKSVLIGYDSRHNSRAFAEETAKVLAANGIRAYMYQELRPTPLVSFGCRYKHCTAAVMVTASHNPKQYNGYKVYWSDGGQVLPPNDKGIMNEFNAITDTAMVKSVADLKNPLITIIEHEVDIAYLQAINTLQNYAQENQVHGHSLKIVYSNLHGTGITVMPQALALWGFSNVLIVEQQAKPDGDFPTASPPNPEERQALRLGIELLEKSNSDILIATDPDADRVAAVVRHHGETVVLNGNQIACICLHHLCEALTKYNRMPAKAAFVKSIVTTELFKVIADAYKTTCVNVLTGFKYIAEKIRQWAQNHEHNYVFGGEESYGYLLGTQARDKDAILSGVLLCEAALHAKRQGKTLLDLLDDLYKKYGTYVEKVISVGFPETKEGREQMNNSMEHLKANPLNMILNMPVSVIEDLYKGVKKDLNTGKVEKLDFPESEVLIYWLEDGTKLIVRPSGTEPKIKIYCGLVNKIDADIDAATKEGNARADAYLQFIFKKLKG